METKLEVGLGQSGISETIWGEQCSHSSHEFGNFCITFSETVFDYKIFHFCFVEILFNMCWQ